jgi:sialic acid synthase SpsE
MVRAITIGGRPIGPGAPCYVIAEAGVNHNGRVDLACQLAEAAHAAGADAVKFQIFDALEQISTGAETVAYQQRETGCQSMREMAQSYDLPWEAHREIAGRCREVDITYMASCFDATAVDFLMSLGSDCVKIGSGEITNYPLLAHAARSAGTILLSTGASTLADVAGAVEWIASAGGERLALFHCVSNYPADPTSLNLRAIQTLTQAFGVPVGFSDHTTGQTAAVAAVALGACLVEKHFTLDRTLPGPDHAMSLDPQALRDFVTAIRSAEQALGDGVKRVQHDEVPTQRAARRSLVARGMITAGERLSDQNVVFKRPATGIDPRLWQAVRGREAAIAIPDDVPITWDMIR